jgi:hypothetical protein
MTRHKANARRKGQMARALTLSVALAASGLIAAAPASAAENRKEVKTRVKISLTQVSGPSGGATSPDYLVKGRVQSPAKACERRWVMVTKPRGHRRDTDHTTRRRRGRFTLTWTERSGEPPEHYLVKALRSFPGQRRGEYGRVCEADQVRLSTRTFTPSEAGIAAATPASAAEEVKEVNTRVRLNRLNYDPSVDGFYLRGRVLSPAEGCERRRRVKVMDGAPRAHGRTTALASKGGSFKLHWHDPTPAEHYRVKAPRSFAPGHRSLKCEPDAKRIRVPPLPSEAGIAAAPASAAEGVKSQVKVSVVRALGGTSFTVQGSVHSSDEDCKRDRHVKLVGWKRNRGLRGHPTDHTGDNAGTGYGPGHFTLYWSDRTPPKHYRIRVRRGRVFHESGDECEADVKRFAWRRY